MSALILTGRSSSEWPTKRVMPSREHRPWPFQSTCPAAQYALVSARYSPAGPLQTEFTHAVVVFAPAALSPVCHPTSLLPAPVTTSIIRRHNRDNSGDAPHATEVICRPRGRLSTTSDEVGSHRSRHAGKSADVRVRRHVESSHTLDVTPHVHVQDTYPRAQHAWRSVPLLAHCTKGRTE